MCIHLLALLAWPELSTVPSQSFWLFWSLVSLVCMLLLVGSYGWSLNLKSLKSLRRSIKELKKTASDRECLMSESDRLSTILESRDLNRIMSTPRGISVGILLAIVFFSGVVFGHSFTVWQQYRHIYVQESAIKVIADPGNRRYETIDLQGTRNPLVICPQKMDGGPDPGFDVDDWITFTAIEKQMPDGGVCLSFANSWIAAWHADKWPAQTVSAGLKERNQ